jgi:hypothetical protein
MLHAAQVVGGGYQQVSLVFTHCTSCTQSGFCVDLTSDNYEAIKRESVLFPFAPGLFQLEWRLSVCPRIIKKISVFHDRIGLILS